MRALNYERIMQKYNRIVSVYSDELTFILGSLLMDEQREKVEFLTLDDFSKEEVAKMDAEEIALFKEQDESAKKHRQEEAMRKRKKYGNALRDLVLKVVATYYLKDFPEFRGFNVVQEFEGHNNN